MQFLKYLFNHWQLVLSLAYDDFKGQYRGSYLGVLWAVIRPMLFVVVIWFIFGIGFKTKPSDEGVPFVLWLLCGLIPWFFFTESVNKTSNAISANTFLVKKTGFKVEILPLVKIISALFIHVLLFAVLLCVFVSYGYYPTFYWLQLPYYLICMILLLVGIGLVASSLRVFIKDVGEIIAVIIQFGFWLTPIFWSIKIIPEQYQSFVKINPMFYIVEGYRNSLIEHKWFWGTA